MSAHSCFSVLLSLSHIVYVCTVLFEQINDDDDDDSHSVQSNFDYVYGVMVDLLNRFYPQCKITVTSRLQSRPCCGQRTV